VRRREFVFNQLLEATLLTSFKSLTPAIFLFVFLSAAPLVHSQSLKSPALVEEFSFLLKDFKMDHQGEVNTLNISISFRYVANIKNADYPDFRWLAKDVETLLTNYPNKTDYWEIVNKQITALLMKKYPAVVSLSCELKVDPSAGVPYSRSSRVTRESRKR
jgi:hypothetical protein